MENGIGAAERLAEIRDRIARAARDAGRQAEEISLIAVTKTYDAGAILPVIGAGQCAFGENRVQEAKGKWPALTASHQGLELHLIGPLQSNKARDAVALFDVIHTIDRPKIAEALAAEIAAQGRKPQLFIQVNTGEEPQKAGVRPDETEALLATCRERLGLTIEGLMCIPPFDEAPDPHFQRLAKLAGRLDLPSLSMGMSADYEAAIRHGATHIRVGSALFGARN
jgi:PLP dependent protein